MMEIGYKLDGRYRIMRSIGEGGMANVYLAHDLILDRDVAIKILRLDLQHDPATMRRFQREELASTELVHPHIVAVYDVGEDHGIQYIAMEYVKGMDLKQYIAAHYPMPYQSVINIMNEILSAVNQAHAHGIIHRDLKPQNILVNESGHIKITDFGIAVALSENSLTQTNSLLGSVHYLSPEQARGSVATKQSDIYALGIILYEMLTSKVPFEGETAVSIALKHFQSDIPSVRKIDPKIPQALENVVLKATAKAPIDRYRSVAEMATDLRTVLQPERVGETKYRPQVDDEETKIIAPIKPPETSQPAATATSQTAVMPEIKPDQALQQQKDHRHSPWLLIVLAVGLVVAIGGGGFAFWQTQQPVTVPRLSHLTTHQAQKQLRQQQLKLGKVTRKSSATVAKGKVIRSTPTSGQKIKKQQSVAVVVSSGQATYKLKDYQGQDYTAVAQQLRQQGFTVKRKLIMSDTATRNQIVRQSLAAGIEVIPRQTTLKLEVGAGANAFSFRNMINWSQASVSEYTNSTGLKLTLKSDYSDTVRSGSVMSQKPTAGSYVQPGDQVTVTISKGAIGDN